MNEIAQQEKLLSLAHRVLNSRESLETLARDHGVLETDLRRTVREYKNAIEKLQRDKQREGQLTDLIPGLLKMAETFHIEGHSLRAIAEYEFKFPELCEGITKGPTKSYRPDVVWFSGEPSEETATVIFEIEDGTSPKHQMGGLAFANILALKFKGPIWFFAIVREKSNITSNSIALSKAYLGPKWALNAFVVHGFRLSSVEESVRTALQHRA